MQRKENKGFSLIESIVALLVLALVLGSAMALFRNSIKISGEINQKIFAEWAAHNYAVLKQTGNWSEIGKLSEAVTIGRYKFVVKSDTTTTSSPAFRKLKITVYPDKSQTEISSITSYSAKDIRW